MKNFTILLIDDIPSNIHALELIIKENFQNLTIITAQSAHQAIRKIMEHDVDLILSDVQMPEISGYELVAYLHAIEQTKHIPIVLITGIYNSDENIKKGYNVGAVEYIAKPIDDELLCAKLRVFIQIFESRKKDQETIHKKERLLEDQMKVLAMVNNLKELPSSNLPKNLEDYSDLIGTDDSLIDLSNLDSLKKEV